MDRFEDVMQWFFDLEAIAKGANWSIRATGIVDGKRAIDETVTEKASADAVGNAYRLFAGAVGPTVMTMLLKSDDAFPECNHSDSPIPPAGGLIALYRDNDGKTLVASVSDEWGKAPEFSVL